MQQINLYQSASSNEGEGPSIIVIAAIVGVVTLGCVGDYASLLWGKYKLNSELKTTETAAVKIEQQLANFKQGFRDPVLDETLPQQLARKQQENARFMRAMAYVQGQLQTASKGFGDPLQALADHHSNGVWLTHIDLRKGGSQINLSGMTAEANNIPKYFGSLSQSDAFKGQRFTGFEISRSEKQPELLSFSLNATPAEADAANKGGRK